MKLAEILTGPEKWHVGSLTDFEGRLCLMGAIDRLHRAEGKPISEVNTEEDDRMLEVIKSLGFRIPRQRSNRQVMHPVARWNDDPARTWDDVALAVSEYDRHRMMNP
jgi:hypothetical protein